MSKLTYPLFFGFGALLVSPVSALAQDNSDQAKSSEQSMGAKVKVGRKFYAKNEMVCKRRAETGTRVKTKTCMTAGQWYQMELDGQSMTEAMQGGIYSTRPDE